MLARPLALLALCGCTLNDGLAPDYIEVSPGIGNSQFNTSPLREFETEAVFVTFGWDLQRRSAAMTENERWAATQRHQETMREIAVGHLAQEARVSSSTIEDALVAHDEGHESDLGESFGHAITSKPISLEDGYARILWAGSLLLMVIGAVLLHRSGTLKQFLGMFRPKG